MGAWEEEEKINQQQWVFIRANRIGDKCQTPRWYRRSWDTCRRGLKLSFSTQMNPRPGPRHRRWPPIYLQCSLLLWTVAACSMPPFERLIDAPFLCSVLSLRNIIFPKPVGTVHFHLACTSQFKSSFPEDSSLTSRPDGVPSCGPTCSPPSSYSAHNYRLLG